MTKTFRNLDVDRIEGGFEGDDAANQASPISINEGEIQKLISSGRHLEALKAILVPGISKLTEPLVNTIMHVLLNIRLAEVEKTIEELSQDEVDLLMKFIYKGFENPVDGSSIHLLVWHQKVFEKGGHGSILRVLCDKKL